MNREKHARVRNHQYVAAACGAVAAGPERCAVVSRTGANLGQREDDEYWAYWRIGVGLETNS